MPKGSGNKGKGKGTRNVVSVVGRGRPRRRKRRTPEDEEEEQPAAQQQEEADTAEAGEEAPFPADDAVDEEVSLSTTPKTKKPQRPKERAAELDRTRKTRW